MAVGWEPGKFCGKSTVVWVTSHQSRISAAAIVSSSGRHRRRLVFLSFWRFLSSRLRRRRPRSLTRVPGKPLVAELQKYHQSHCTVPRRSGNSPWRGGANLEHLCGDLGTTSWMFLFCPGEDLFFLTMMHLCLLEVVAIFQNMFWKHILHTHVLEMLRKRAFVQINLFNCIWLLSSKRRLRLASDLSMPWAVWCLVNEDFISDSDEAITMLHWILISVCFLARAEQTKTT